MVFTHLLICFRNVLRKQINACVNTIRHHFPWRNLYIHLDFSWKARCFMHLPFCFRILSHLRQYPMLVYRQPDISPRTLGNQISVCRWVLVGVQTAVTYRVQTLKCNVRLSPTVWSRVAFCMFHIQLIQKRLTFANLKL